MDYCAVADCSGWLSSSRLLQVCVSLIRSLVIHGKKEVTIKDVMIGEVWIASGQSNMAFSLDGVENAETEVPRANYPQIRLFSVPKKIALTPQDNTLPAHWEICTPETAKSFSATCCLTTA